MNKLIILLVFLMSPTLIFALDTPAPSPASEINQRVGLTDFTVTYSRPSVKDRQIFGGLVPYDQVWRTGANASTKLSFNQDILFGETPIKAGDYALYTIPGKEEWTVILSSNTGLWGSGGYTADDDALRVDIVPTKTAHAQETFLITFDKLRNDSAHLVLLWENTHVAVPIKVHTGKQVKAGIEEAMKDMEGWTPRDYASAAGAYYEYEIDHAKALTWINKAVESNDNAYWWLHSKAKIETALGHNEDAIVTAEKSLKLASAANDGNGDTGYMQRNQQLLEKLNN